MTWRFRRRLRIMPGVFFNLSKSGVSTSIGPRGAHVTVGHGQTRVSAGLPGSGISYTTTLRGRRRGVPTVAAVRQRGAHPLPLGAYVLVYVALFFWGSYHLVKWIRGF